MRPITERDLVVFLVALVIGSGLGFFDALIDLQPNALNGVLNGVLLVGVCMAFYQIGARRPPD